MLNRLSKAGSPQPGQAVADILSGDFNPSGKLPIRFYKDTTQLPHFEDYTMKGRTYRYMSEAPLFTFGYGLCYTSFTIGNAQTSKTEIRKNEDLQLTIPVSNTGRREGAEVVQVYVRKVNDAGGPTKTLRCFKRVGVGAGKTIQAIIDLPYNAFEFFDTTSGVMKVTPGAYEIWYGNSSAAKDLKMTKVNVL
ncbi:glycoside hydrolase family 3 C-terminal domain-containing protein [Chitinophagaceae bacterium LB-8]|uniref:Glycoside hydrolase family 3 C-terminal domain-containing protein n=1 Tax=Paraflavisolibacter caeni TaxID=2982496 RepID=A0A9X2Y0C4_9BACT|nr:fibronectin type III-like domain-contianing protein [Paraflavisolibacter caeni]MCU7552280.1 glycoside hydrolase family 3 C-terminal domain-containing protein [Paraflavisolibacter caeni]